MKSNSATRFTEPDRSATAQRYLRATLIVLACLLCVELRLDALRLTELERPTVRADSAEYYFYTWNLRHFGIYTPHDSRRDGPPVSADYRRWPGMALLALPFAADPDTLVPRFLLAQTLASVAAGLLVYALGSALAGYWAGLGALLLYAVSPHLVNANLYFLTESPMTTLLIAACFALLRGVQTGARGWWIASGALFGVATLTRPFIELAVPLMLGALWVSGYAHRQRAVICLGLAFLALVLPWHVLVWIGEPMGTPGLLVGTIQHGMYPDFMHQDRPETYGYPYRFDPDAARIAGSLHDVLAELARRAFDEPGRYLRWYLLGKPLALWQWSEVQGARDFFIYPPLRTPFDFLPQFRLAAALAKAAHYPLLVASLLALLAAWIPALAARMRADVRLFLRMLGALFAWTTLLHMVGAPFPRYHMPLKPLVFVVAMVAASVVVVALRSARAPRDASS